MQRLLRRFRISRDFITFLLRAVELRDTYCVLCCLRRVFSGVRLVTFRRFIFSIQYVLRGLFAYCSMYSGLSGYRLELRGKVGRGAGGRASKFLLIGGRRSRGGRWYKSYSWLIVRTQLGSISIRGVMFY